MDATPEFEQFTDDLRKQLFDPEGDSTIEETLRGLEFLETRLKTISQAIERNGTPSDRVLSLHNLAAYAGWLLLMLRDGLGRPIEFYGWISRGLFELYLLTLFVLRSEENLRVFRSAATTDEITMLEGISRLEGNASPEARKGLRAEIERLKASRGDHAVKLPDYASIAIAVDVKDEYDAFWKLYSKYVHPSSWVVNANPTQVRNESFQQIFQLQAQFNAYRVLKLVESNVRPAQE